MNNLRDSSKSIVSTFRRFHMVIFIVGLTGLLAVAVLLLNGVIAKTSSTADSSPDGTKAGFDQTTINRIKQLKTSDEPSIPLDLSNRRISPFSE